MKNPFKKQNKLGATMPVRSIEDVQKDYGNALGEYGSITYQIEILEEQKDKVFKQMKDLNMEGAAIQAEQKIAEDRKRLAAVDQRPVDEGSPEKVEA